MRTVPGGLAAHLGGQATTLACCWKLTRTDGTVMGFTDHDAAIVLDGLRYEAATGLTAGEAETALGLAAGSQEVEGALSSLAIEERDIAAGRYDGARIETILVNWQAPEQRLSLDVAELGEVKRGGPAFTAELRGIASRLDRRRGRLYRRRCDAVLGDARCAVNLLAPGLGLDGLVADVLAGSVVVEAAFGADIQMFRQGSLAWISGPAAGLWAEIASLRRLPDGRVTIGLVEGAPAEAAAGDLVRLTAGCDKSYAICKARFGNGVNFRGFPHLPGNDAALGIAKTNGRHDGSPVVP